MPDLFIYITAANHFQSLNYYRRFYVHEILICVNNNENVTLRVNK